MIMRDQEDRSLLVKNHSSSTYDLLIKKAEKEGRLNGRHKCPICGMRSNSSLEADACCERVRERF